MGNYDWITYKFDEKPNTMICERCGAKATSPTPCRLDDAERIFNTFIKQHKKCKEKEVRE